jgi:hypothetical protein
MYAQLKELAIIKQRDLKFMIDWAVKNLLISCKAYKG